jgi:hypothetical protein
VLILIVSDLSYASCLRSRQGYTFGLRTMWPGVVAADRLLPRRPTSVMPSPKDKNERGKVNEWKR